MSKEDKYCPPVFLTNEMMQTLREAQVRNKVPRSCGPEAESRTRSRGYRLRLTRDQAVQLYELYESGKTKFEYRSQTWQISCIKKHIYRKCWTLDLVVYDPAGGKHELEVTK